MKALSKRLLHACICRFVTSSIALAQDCPEDRRVYSFDWKDGYKTFFTSQLSRTHNHGSTRFISFETKRGKDFVWSVDGEMGCAYFFCSLNLKPHNSADDENAFSKCFKAGNLSPNALTIPVTSIPEDGRIAYIAFGNLAGLSWGCGEHMKAKVSQKSLLRHENPFGLPEYVRFDHCRVN